MIRYPITEAELLERIDNLVPGWREKARARTAEYVKARKYAGGTEFWGQVKPVYIALQHEKCAYCESKLQGATLASKVHEVEHFRPKSKVSAWPNHKVARWKDFKPTWPTGDASDTGYYRMAYQPLNYAIACTRCNSTLKSDYFPVRGTRDFDEGDVRTLNALEAPLLFYPISDADPDDPEGIITFEGVLAVPVKTRGPAYQRAVTTIEFFQLNHEDLTSRRGDQIRALWFALKLAEDATHRPLARKTIDDLCSEYSQFSACANAFRELYAQDREKADALAAVLIERTQA